jgi:DNA polymerase-3 subunit delta'
VNLKLLDNNSGYINLLKDVQNGNLNHAYLIVSEDGFARECLFTKIALAVFCNTSCGQCPSCKQILSNNNINVHTYDGKKVNVAKIKEITDDIHILPVGNDKKLYFINNAQNLDPRVQNKLLKSLEEPPMYVTIFLGVDNELGLLNTIKSRSKKVYIEPININEIYNDLLDKGIDDAMASLAATYSMGNYEKALAFADDTRYQTIYEETFLTLTNLKNSSQIVDYLYKDIFNKDNISLTLDFMEIFLNDILKICSGSKTELNTLNRDYDLKALAKGFTPTGVSMALLAINDGRKKLNFYINATSVAEKILFDILEAKYKWQQ